jgi:hypothetical protein
MSNFEEFKQKAKDTAETIADKSVEFYKFAEEKTKIIAKLTKLSTEIALQKNTVKKLYTDLGKKYYELYQEEPVEALKQTCEEITAALEIIEKKQQRWTKSNHPRSRRMNRREEKTEAEPAAADRKRRSRQRLSGPENRFA